ncbi:alpha/beta-hydrolase [Delitschia confertaspora ATCC 74209]|uniref:Alpha/beta-hydrolase n=1 Tax=Delitschia confertaspora ATCC 74209 TaxID=1513339 RepID=A0A9P4MX84_9PLEO|nr:alpha/beta-hydrolase [Delitschia confertaspora ATCC 74209]
MPINTVSVATAVTPTVIHTYLTHYLNRKPLRQKPTAHISYHEGLELVRRFLHYASFHTVEDIQAFTSQWVPVPTWVHVEEVKIPSECLEKSTAHLQAQLGPDGIKQVGGGTWWQWRPENAPLRAEWIEMRKDYYERTQNATQNATGKGQRIMLYVHGGAYYFGSVDEHRYQMQRHARKLKARVLAPRYRLAPQYPFPCGLMDCLAAYLYLLENGHDPSTILLAGDSAGGGMVLSILVTLRDQGIPLPAGAILISPWVDLTHSFPSLGGDGKMDYIPPHGFLHKPSMNWPPPNADDLLALEQKSHYWNRITQGGEEQRTEKEHYTDRVLGYSVKASERPDPDTSAKPPGENVTAPHYVAEDGKYTIGPKSTLSVYLEDKMVEIKDQIQLYTENHLLTHPLVSPALQPTLGGLPPLLIQTGGGELLRDEQIYLAHKAASPMSYLPRTSNHLTSAFIQSEASKYRPTNVQLQVWDDLCHVAPTLSFTRPAKYMYRSIAQFGAWALARAQNTPIDIMDDDAVSVVSSRSSSSSSSTAAASKENLSADEIKLSMPRSTQGVTFESLSKKNTDSAIGKAGDPLPPFTNHMIRQRVDRHGTIHDLPSPSEIPALNLPPAEIGVPKVGPLNKWMHAQKEWNQKFAKQKIKVQKRRVEYMELGYEGFDGETPPPTAMAGRRLKGKGKEKKKKTSWGMALWSLWGSKHDEKTLVREKVADETAEQRIIETVEEPGNTENRTQAMQAKSKTRERSRHSAVTDQGQTSTLEAEELDHALLTPNAPSDQEGMRKASPLPSPMSEIVVTPAVEGDDVQRPTSPPTVVPFSDTLSTRPTRGGVAYPFRLNVEGGGRDVNASMVTLQSLSVEGEGNKAEDSEVEGGEWRPRKDGVEAPVLDKLDSSAEAKDSGNAAAREAGFAAEADIKKGKGERPGVERFETARESLNG